MAMRPPELLAGASAESRGRLMTKRLPHRCKLSLIIRRVPRQQIVGICPRTGSRNGDHRSADAWS